MFVRKNKYVTEEQLERIVNSIDLRIIEKARYSFDMLKFYRETVHRHSEELLALRTIVKEAGLVVELNNKEDNSVVEYLGTKWKIKKVK